VNYRFVKFFPLLTGIFWGTSYVSTKYALIDFSPMVIAAWRAVFAYLVLVIFYLLLGKREYLKPKTQDLGIIALLSLTGTISFWLLMNLSLQYTTTTNSALLVTSHPLFVILLSPLIIKETITRREWVGLLVGLIGSYLVITQGQITGLFQSQTLQGDAIALGAGLSFGLHVLFSRKYTRKLQPGYLTVNVFGFGALVLIPLSIVTGNSLAIWHGTGLAITSVIWLGLICSAVAFLLLLTALERTRAASASLLFFIAPVVAAISAYFLLKEQISLGTIVGGLFICVGILVTVINKKSVRPSEKQVDNQVLSE